MDLHRAGKSKQAMDQFRKCVDVTPEMAFEVIQALKAAGVDFVVAPYEADAQLAYLEKHGIVDGIVTEDSDLLVFGCKKVPPVSVLHGYELLAWNGTYSLFFGSLNVHR